MNVVPATIAPAAPGPRSAARPSGRPFEDVLHGAVDRGSSPHDALRPRDEQGPVGNDDTDPQAGRASGPVEQAPASGRPREGDPADGAHAGQSPLDGQAPGEHGTTGRPRAAEAGAALPDHAAPTAQVDAVAPDVSGAAAPLPPGTVADARTAHGTLEVAVGRASGTGSAAGSADAALRAVDAIGGAPGTTGTDPAPASGASASSDQVVATARAAAAGAGSSGVVAAAGAATATAGRSAVGVGEPGATGGPTDIGARVTTPAGPGTPGGAAPTSGQLDAVATTSPAPTTGRAEQAATAEALPDAAAARGDGGTAPAAEQVLDALLRVGEPAATARAGRATGLAASVAARVEAAVAALEHTPPPQDVRIEVDGLVLLVRLRGDVVRVQGEHLPTGWDADLAEQLGQQGYELDGRARDGRDDRDEQPERGPVAPVGPTPTAPTGPTSQRPGGTGDLHL